MWFLSPSGWPVFADSAEEQAELFERGYDVITEGQVQAAIDAFHAAEASPPSTTVPGWALASDVAAALATKANASSLPGKLSIADIGNPATSGGAALTAASVAAAADAIDDTTSPLYTSAATVLATRDLARVASGRAPRNSAVAMGDSNTVNPLGTDISLTAATSNATGWFQQLCVQSKGRIEHGGIFARASYTTAQVRDAKLAAVLALNPRPGACFIMLGTNDMDLAGDGSGFNLAAATTAYVDIITQLRNVGVLPIPCLPIPNGSTGSTALNQQIWNKRLRDLADRYGLPVVDFYSPVLDPATGGILAAYQQDSKHVNAAGRRVLATAALAQGIGGVFPPARVLTAKSSVDPSNLIPSGRGVYLVTTGWSSFGDTANAVVSTVAPQAADGLAGNWHQVVHSGSALFNRQMSAATTPGWAAGDVVEFTGRIQTTGIEAAKASGLTPSIYPRVAFRNSATTVVAYANATLPSPQFDTDVADGLFRVRSTVDATWASFHIELNSQGFSAGFPLTVRYGELTVRNLTQLGIYTG